MLPLQALISSEKLLLCHMFVNGVQVIINVLMSQSQTACMLQLCSTQV